MHTLHYEDMDWEELGPCTLYIDRVKEIVPETFLIGDNGESRYIIACPDIPVYFDLAYALQEAISGSIEGPTRVIAAGEISEEEKRKNHIIALGDINCNPLLGELYHFYYVAVDHAYPGPGGYVLQTVYDPWGHGTNVIVCGGSDLAGTRQAMQRALASLIRDGRVWFPRLHDIVISESFRERYPAVTFECTPEYRRWAIEHVYERLEQGMHRGATPTVAHAGLMYHLTGDERFAELYRDLFKILYQAAVNDPGTGPWSPWGFDADFQAVPMLQAWDVVEEAPVFSERDRLYITNHLLWYVKYMAEHAQRHRPQRPRSSRHNHYTFAALGVLYGAIYFRKYYQYPEVEEWLALADECFRVQAEAFKANEDCNSYQWLTFYHTLKYALVRPDPTFITSGHARQCLDLGIATMDNLGYQVPYGDCREYAGTFSEVPFFKAVAWLLKDPAYQPVLEMKERARPAFNIDGLYPVGYEYEVRLGEGRPLRRFFDVSALPVDPLYFETFDGPQHIEYEKAFDKIVFRHSLDPEDDYLLLDGLSNGGHLHYDGNSIVRYTSKGRIWLADADYMKAPQKFHNTLLVFKDGRGALIPPYVELGHTAWLKPFGYSRSVVRAYGGTDWTRRVLEVRGRYFVVMDEVVALEPGDYDLHCVWRSVGDATLDTDQRMFVVDQDGPRFELRCAPGYAAATELSYFEEPMIWGTWDRYPYHGRSADVKVLKEKAAVRLEKGERYAFFNLFGANGPYPALIRLSERAVHLDDPDEPALLGAGDELGAVIEGMATDADFIYASERRMFLTSVSRLSLQASSLFESSSPVDLTLDLDSGRAVVQAGDKVALRLGPEEETLLLAAGGHEVQVAWQGVMREAIARALRGSARQAAAAPDRGRIKVRQRLADREQGTIAWQMRLPEGQTPYSLWLGEAGESEGAPFYVGTAEGTLFCVADGQVCWAFRCGGRVNDVTLADVNGDGTPEVILGSADHYVYLLDASGREIWRRELPYYMHEPTVEAVLVVDLELPEGKAVLAGSNNCHVHAFSPDGRELWRYEVIHGVNDLTSADMNGDGRDEVLAVTEWWTWHCINAAGEGLWPTWSVRPRYGPGANVVRAADVNGDGVPEMICGAIDSCVYAFNHAGERVWEFFTGEEIRSLACADLDGDGVPEIVVGSMNGYVYALDGYGREIWHCGLDDPVNTVVVLEGGDRPLIAVGTDSSLVFLVDARGQVVAWADVGHALRGIAARVASDGIEIYAAARDGHLAKLILQR